LIPGVQNGTASVYTNNTWTAATQSVTYDNASNTVTLHFNRPLPPTIAFQVISDPEGGGIVDANYAWSVGGGFNEANWSSYQSQASTGSYNTKMQWNPVGSGPFMVQTYTPGQSVELVPNPHYGGVSGIPKQTTTVVVNWVRTPDTAILMLQDGQADVISGAIPPSDFPAVQKLQSKGLVNIYGFGTLNLWFYIFNIKIDKDLEATQFGAGFNEPSNYFADLPTRLAWINAYDYAGYLNNILGNAKYGTTFGSLYNGFIGAGELYSVPPDQVALPAQNLAAAKGNFSISAWANQKITVPIVVDTGDPVNVAGAEEWAGILSQISNGNINAKVIQAPYTEMVADTAQDMNPMGVCWAGNFPDYPDPSDAASTMLQQGGYYPSGDNWLASYFATLATPGANDLVHVNGSTFTQDQVYSWINGNVTLGAASVDPTVRQNAYLTATKLAIAMGLYVFVYQVQMLWYWRSWLKGYELQENLIIGAGGDLLFYWLTKG